MEGQLAVLKAREEANRWFAISVAIAIAKRDPTAHRDTLEALAAAAFHLRTEGKEDAAEALDITATAFKALTQDGESDPVKVLLMKAFLHLDTPSDQQAALLSWLRSATADELSDQIHELLGRLSRTPPQGDA
ncbi:hypothetical protein [Roseospira goensis]|uniref:Uncharacterized protein n=1 Tax=Roseospira goensis TaxID=391922 RepID=A0A7W6S1X7_9PROT|nr:hypothetical protein [Roseospira goensis]MBB4287405.1 hypothetical protein [Roseospira goensis]